MSKCRTKKVQYPTEQDAKDALWLVKFRQLVWYKQNRVYLCKFCGMWHLTSKQNKL